MESEVVSFMVLLAGSGQPFLEVLALQTADDKVGTEALNLDLARRSLSILRENPDAKADALTADLNAYGAALSGDQTKMVTAVAAELRSGLGLFLSQRYLKDILSFDPGTALRDTECAVLALMGEFDAMNVGLPAIQEALETGKSRDFSVELVPDLNHMLQTAAGHGNPREWSALEETVAPRVLERIGEWIVGHGRVP
jgi:hypothetical protein